MHIETWGDGESVILVHGGGDGGVANFSEQRPLSHRWRLILPDRPGHGRTPSADRSDFATDAPLIAELLEDGAHLVGHSYGAVVCLLAAALRPAAVRSLTLIEPPAFSIARDLPEVAALEADLRQLFQDVDDPAEFVAGFFRLAGLPGTPPPLPLAAVEAMRSTRGPWEAEIPLDKLAAAHIPTLVVTGGHSHAFDQIAQRLAETLAGTTATVPGAMHAVQSTGRPFNTVLEQHLLASNATATDKH